MHYMRAKSHVLRPITSYSNREKNSFPKCYSKYRSLQVQFCRSPAPARDRLCYWKQNVQEQQTKDNLLTALDWRHSNDTWHNKTWITWRNLYFAISFALKKKEEKKRGGWVVGGGGGGGGRSGEKCGGWGGGRAILSCGYRLLCPIKAVSDLEVHGYSSLPMESVDQSEASSPPYWRVQILSRRLLGKKGKERVFSWNIIVMLCSLGQQSPRCPAHSQKWLTFHRRAFCFHYLMANARYGANHYN